MITKKMEKKKLISYIVAVIIFLVYLLTVNKWLPLLFGSNAVNTVDFRKFKGKDTVYFSVDSIEFGDNLLESCTISGWGFCETNNDNSEKELILILRSSDKSYAIYPKTTKREDVGKVFADKTMSDNHGFNVTVSTVGMKNGIYDLYIYCKENDENYGVVNAGIKLNKLGVSLTRYADVSSRVDNKYFRELTEDKNIYQCIDSSKIENRHLQIIGWAFIEGTDTSEQDVYVRLTDEEGNIGIYDTQAIQRPDVGVAYESDLYNNSGFKAIIPTDTIPDGDIRIEIIIENKGNTYLSPKVYMFSASI